MSKTSIFAGLNKFILQLYIQINQNLQGSVTTEDMQSPHHRPPLLRIGQLDMKDAHCAKKNDERKISYHIISRLGATAVHDGAFWAPKNSTFYKSSQIFIVQIRIDLTLIFCIYDLFFVPFLVFEIQSLLVIFLLKKPKFFP